MNMLSAVTGTIGILMLIAELNIMLETEKKCLILVSVSELLLFSAIIFIFSKCVIMTVSQLILAYHHKQ